MSDSHIGIYADRRFVKVKSFATASRPKSTSVKVEFEVTNSWALEDLIRCLHAAQHPKQDEIL
jgi:sigma54-dependent transcription regulator